MLGLGPVCCSPALHWVPGCTQEDAQGGLGVFIPQITSFRVHGWGCKLVLEAGGGQAPHPRVLLQHRDGGDTEEPGWEPGSGFLPAALGGSAQYPLGASSALSHRPRVSPRAPGGSCSGLHPASQCWAAREPAFAAALCIPATMPAPERGRSLCSPGTPPLAKPMALSQLGFSFVVESREMRKVPSIAFSTPAAEDAQTRRGCITQSNFAFNHAQASRLPPCRRAFGLLQPLACPFAPSGCGDALESPLMVAGGWGPTAEWPPDTRFLTQHRRSVPLPASANLTYLEGKRLCRAPWRCRHCKTPRGTQSTRNPAVKRRPAELQPQPTSPCVPPSSCWHRHRPGVAPQRHAEPSWGRAVKCKATHRGYKYFSGECFTLSACRWQLGAAGRLRGG